MSKVINEPCLPGDPPRLVHGRNLTVLVKVVSSNGLIIIETAKDGDSRGYSELL